MSHTIQMSIINKDIYNSTCDNLSDKLKEIEKYNIHGFKNSIDELNKQINTYRKIIKDNNYMEYEDFIQFQRKLSTTEKEVANLYITILNNNFNEFIQKLDANKLDISYEIKRHGILANEVIEYLSNNNITINKKNFDKYLEIVEESKLTNEKLNKYIFDSYKLIDKCDLKDEIKVALKKDIRNINSLNLAKDINAIILSKENESNMVVNLAKKIIQLLKNQNFSKVGEAKWDYDLYNKNVVLKFSMKNEQNNIIQMIVDSSLHLKYKLGNYKGHACEKTTNKLIEDMKRIGMDVTHTVIKRDYEEENKCISRELENKY